MRVFRWTTCHLKPYDDDFVFRVVFLVSAVHVSHGGEQPKKSNYCFPQARDTNYLDNTKMCFVDLKFYWLTLEEQPCFYGLFVFILSQTAKKQMKCQRGVFSSHTGPGEGREIWSMSFLSPFKNAVLQRSRDWVFRWILVPHAAKLLCPGLEGFLHELHHSGGKLHRLSFCQY